MKCWLSEFKRKPRTWSPSRLNQNT